MKPDSSYWKHQKFLNYRSQLQRSSQGCPWPAHIIALAKALESQNKFSEIIIRHAKQTLRVSDDDLMGLLFAWQNKDWMNKDNEVFIYKKGNE